MTRRWTAGLLAAALAALAGASTAAATCDPIAPVACDDCFAVFVMPDTQNYVQAAYQPEGGAHLDLVTRYLCQNRTAWQEPSTGKVMPILMVVQLGDIVDHPVASEPAGPLAEWVRADAAFDNLDACDPVVPYVVAAGNHDIDSLRYEGPSVGYDTYFGADRWQNAGYGCQDPSDCDWEAGEWFIGGGDPIAAFSRNNVGAGSPGPPTAQPGRHRAAVIRAPNGQRFVFLGLEIAFDFPPAAPGFEGVEGDDSAWPKQVLADYPGAATIVFHHSLLWTFGPPGTPLRWGPETWHADSLSEPPLPWDGPIVGGMEDLWREVVEPFPQVLMLFTGHVLIPNIQGDYTIERPPRPPVHAFLRNFQIESDGAGRPYGGGWNLVAAFDPDAGEIRVRSYRIDDTDAYADPPVDHDHDGTPAATECFDTDWAAFGERVIAYDFAPPPVPALPLGGLGVIGVGLAGSIAWAWRRAG